MARSAALAVMLALTSAALGASAATAAPGALDGTFGTGGATLANAGNNLVATGSALALDPAGNLVVGGTALDTAAYIGAPNLPLNGPGTGPNP